MANPNRPIKTPFVTVQDERGIELATSVSEGDLVVSQFRYKFNDEDDDTCLIRLQMSNPKSLDVMGIRRGGKMRVKWGYLEGPLSHAANVVIRDVNSKYGYNIIYTDLECTDYLSYLKIVRSDDVGRGPFIEYIVAQSYGKYNIVIQDRGRIIYAQRWRKKEWEEGLTDPDPIPEHRILPNPDVADPWDEFRNSPFNPISRANFRMDPGGVWDVDSEHPIRAYLERETGIPTANRSTYIVIQDMFKSCPHGPWFISGRADTLYIHNRNLAGNIFREYKYKDEPGHLVDFSPKTKYDNFDKQVITHAGMDPQNRVNFFVDDYRRELFNQENPKQILEDQYLTKEEKIEKLKKWASLRSVPYARFGVVRSMYILPTHDARYQGVPGRLTEGDRLRDHNPDPMTRSGEYYPWGYSGVMKAYGYTVPLALMSDAADLINNRQRELAMEKEEASIIVEGDPYLKDEMIVKISNVYTQHQGNYYIKDCEHTISNNGYRTAMNGFKVVPESIISSFTGLSQEEYDALEDNLKGMIDTQYQREQYLFGRDLVVVSRGEVRIPMYGAPADAPGVGAITRTLPYTEGVSYSDLIGQGYPEDMAVEELVRLFYEGKDTGIEFKARDK